MDKLTKIRKDPTGRRYYFAAVIFDELTESPYLFKEKRPELVQSLIKDMADRWLLEPITLYQDADGQIYLAGGKHRMQAAIDRDALPEDTRPGKDPKKLWTKTPVDAKVYLDLPSHEIPDVVMALDDVRKKAAAGERQAGLAYAYEAALEAAEAAGESTDEYSVLQKIGYVRTRMRVKKGGKIVVPVGAARSVIIANHIERLKDESKVFGPMLVQRQVPRRALESAIEDGNYWLVTRENLGFALNHIVRAEPVKAEETKGGVNPRDVEFENLKKALDLLAEELIIPLADDDLDQAAGICRRHPLEAVGLYLQSVFARAYQLPIEDALMSKPIKQWAKYKKCVGELEKVNWADPILQGYRSAQEIFKGVPGNGFPAGLREYLDKAITKR